MIDKLVLCSCCACEDAAGVKVSKNLTKVHLWPILFDDDDFDHGLMMIVMSIMMMIVMLMLLGIMIIIADCEVVLERK